MKKLTIVWFSFFLASCVSDGPVAPPVGYFTQMGPVLSKGAKELSIRWTYGFQFYVSTDTVTAVNLSCAPIPGSTFSFKGLDLNIKPGAPQLWEGDLLPVSPDKTAWLFDSSTTSATCELRVVRQGFPDTVQRQDYRLTGDQKAALLEQMRRAHETNRSAMK